MTNLECDSGFNLLLLTKESLKNTGPVYKRIGRIITDANGIITSKQLILSGTGPYEIGAPLSPVDSIHEQFIKLFQDEGGILSQPHGLIAKPYVLRSEDIVSVVFGVIKWRRCTGFLVFQKSNQGHRFLFYVCDKIMHHGISFGTDCYGIRIDEIVKDFHELVEANKVEISKLQSMKVVINDKETITLQDLLEQKRPIICEVVYWGTLLKTRQIIDSDFSLDRFGI
jgi:hypothetical protein